MTLKELVARNVSAALRETLNAELVAKHSKEGEIPNKVIEALREARILLEEAHGAIMKEVGRSV
jgi:hypothetical protein